MRRFSGAAKQRPEARLESRVVDLRKQSAQAGSRLRGNSLTLRPRVDSTGCLCGLALRPRLEAKPFQRPSARPQVGEDRGRLLTQTRRKRAARHHHEHLLPQRCDLETECANLLQFVLKLQENLSLAVQQRGLRVINEAGKRCARHASSPRRLEAALRPFAALNFAIDCVDVVGWQ